MDVNDIIKKNKLKRASYVDYNKGQKKELSSKFKYFKNLITRTLITIILVLVSIIYTNIKPENKRLYKKYVLENTLSFTKINNIYHDLFGEVDIINKNTSDTAVSTNSLNFSNIEAVDNSFKVGVTKGEAINVITSGIVVFNGEKDDLGTTVIIQGNDGVDIWYSGLIDVSAKIYDYVEAASVLGVAGDDNIYLTFNKDDQYLSYDEYFKEV